MKPLAIDLFCGLGGWTDGLLAEGYDVVGFDIEQHVYGEHRYPAQLVLQDVLTIHGSQLKSAALIVASPPCQFFSYTAMPWKKAKALAAAVRADPGRLEKELALFKACFRIQREASAAAGRHIPLVVENVRGAQPWVGRSRWAWGSFHLWGDVPALMPIAKSVKVPTMGAGWYPPGHPKHVRGLGFNTHADRHIKNTGGSWFNIAHNTTSGKGQNPDGRKVPERIVHVRDGAPHTKHLTNPDEHAGKLLRRDGKPHAHQLTNPDPGVKHTGSGAAWFDTGIAGLPSGSSARKAASAMIAKIPLPLSRWIAATYRPAEARAA